MKTKTKTNPVVVTFNSDINPLGCAVRVTYVPATNCLSSKWKAEISDGKFKAKAFAVFGYVDDQADKNLAIKSCLTKWAATFETSPPKSFTLHSKGFDGSSDLYFFTINR
jgi:hypothetical protein